MNKSLIKSKFKALGIHWAVSLLIFLLIFIWVQQILYPSVYFKMSGGIQGLQLMFWVDVVLGPLLTFLVFNPSKKKKEIITDFTVIALVQLGALVYGLNVVYQEHPKLLVLYPKDTATVVSQRDYSHDPRLNQIDLNNMPNIAGIPAVMLTTQNNKPIYANPMDTPQLLQEANTNTRRYIATSRENQNDLASLDKSFANGLTLSVMGKYTGAYFFLSPELEYINHFGEQSLN